MRFYICEPASLPAVCVCLSLVYLCGSLPISLSAYLSIFVCLSVRRYSCAPVWLYSSLLWVYLSVVGLQDCLTGFLVSSSVCLSVILSACLRTVCAVLCLWVHLSAAVCCATLCLWVTLCVQLFLAPVWLCGYLSERVREPLRNHCLCGCLSVAGRSVLLFLCAVLCLEPICLCGYLSFVGLFVRLSVCVIVCPQRRGGWCSLSFS